MPWLRDKNITFNLKDFTYQEQFNIWQSWENRAQPVAGEDGQPLKFPIRDGSLKGEDGVVRDVQSEIKYLKAGDFQAKYPKFSRNTSYVRTIYVDGQEWQYRFPSSANRKLMELIANVQSLGQDALKTTYRQSYNAGAAPVDKYRIEIVQQSQPQAQQAQAVSGPPQVSDVNAPVQAEAPQQPQQVVQPTPSSTPTESGTSALTPAEQEVLSVVKGLPSKISKEQFSRVLDQNNLPKARFELLWQRYDVEKK